MRRTGSRFTSITVREIAVRIDGRAEIGGEIVEPLDPPVGVLAREPGRDEAGFILGRDVRAGMRQAHHERRVAAVDGQPVGMLLMRRPHP